MKEFYQDVDFNGQSLINFSLETLPSSPSSPVIGRVYMNSSTGDVMAYSSSGWVNLSKPTLNGAWLVLNIIGELSGASNPPFPTNPTAGDTWLLTSDGTVGGLATLAGDRLTYTAEGWVLLNDSTFTWQVISGIKTLSLSCSYAIDLTSGASQIRLPSSPPIGGWVRFIAYGNNTLSVNLSGGNYQGSASLPSFPTGQAIYLVYLNNTTGWVKG